MLLTAATLAAVVLSGCADALAVDRQYAPNYLGRVKTPRFDPTYERAIEFAEDLRYNMTHDWEGDPDIIIPRLPADCPYIFPEFSCVAPGAVPPATNARSLRAGNIEAIISLGDSITAGFGIDSGRLPLGSITEFRGRSWAPGGEAGSLTVANFLKAFSPNLRGPSEGTTPPLSKGTALNAAVSGARIDDIAEQILEVEQRLFTDEYKDIREGWKLFTLLIGANDLCQACKDDEQDLPERFERDLRAALLEIKTRLPKSFVAITGIFNVSGVFLSAQTDTYCRLVLPTLNFCPCSENAEGRVKMDDVAVKFNLAIQKVTAEFGDSDPNFAAVYEPALTQVDILDYGQDYLSDLDCFHPNRCAHAAFAVGLWNNLFESPAEKTFVLDPKDLKIKCPGPDDFLQ